MYDWMNTKVLTFYQSARTLYVTTDVTSLFAICWAVGCRFCHNSAGLEERWNFLSCSTPLWDGLRWPYCETLLGFECLDPCPRDYTTLVSLSGNVILQRVVKLLYWGSRSNYITDTCCQYRVSAVAEEMFEFIKSVLEIMRFLLENREVRPPMLLACRVSISFLVIAW
jgi:hypothetical protein